MSSARGTSPPPAKTIVGAAAVRGSPSSGTKETGNVSSSTAKSRGRPRSARPGRTAIVASRSGLMPSKNISCQTNALRERLLAPPGAQEAAPAPRSLRDMQSDRMLIITPVRNEADHIEGVARGLAAQTVPPALWVVVDDNSTDGTDAVLARLAEEIDFMRVVSTPPDFTKKSADRLAVAAAPRAFNFGLALVSDFSDFTHIGKLDGDVELDPDYFELILAEFHADPQLGIGGGVILERRGGDWRPTPSAPEHVRGALKLWSRRCFADIGGVVERLGWDGIDETLARMHGYTTRSFDAAKGRHFRETGSADGRLRGHVRWGEAHWILNHGVVWTTVRAVKVARIRPRGASGAAYLYGYARAAARRVPRVEVDGYRDFVRTEQRRRMSAAVFGARLNRVGSPPLG
jgi:poly-beta-1,6-N-acetyl-D-glucosamine synthase